MTKLSPKLNENANESSSKTQKALILKALQQGDRLTHMDAEKRFNCLRPQTTGSQNRKTNDCSTKRQMRR